MKRGWRTEPLGALCDVVGGGTPSKGNPAFYSGEIPWATVRDMRQEVITETECSITKEAVASSATNIIPAGNVIIATRVGLGKVCLLGQDTAINQDLRGIIPRDTKTLSVRFLYWWLRSMAGTIIAEGTGATVQGVRLPFVKSLHVPLPPLAEQQRIVELLDNAFAGLTTAEAHAENNRRCAQAVFESKLQSVFTRRGKGWIESTIGAEVRFIDYRGKTPVKTSNGIRLITAKNVKMGYLQESPMEFIAADSYESWMTRGIPKRGDVLFTTEAPLANVAQLDTDEKVAFAQRIIIMQPNTAKLNSTFLKYLLISRPVQDRIRIKGTGATVQGIKASLLKTVEISFPKNLSEQESIAGALSALSVETMRLSLLYERKQAALVALKQSLLHQAFAGNI